MEAGQMGEASTGARERALAVALDLEPGPARSLGAALAGQVGYLKVGLSLFCREGPAVVSALKAAGARIFLDLKLHDIPNTVALAAEAVGALGVDLLTVHAAGGEAMVRAAVEGASKGAESAGCRAPRILAVTVLTSLDALGLARLGFRHGPDEAVPALAALATGSGAAGVVCSPREAARVRAAVGPSALIATPGIRAEGEARGDQARAETVEAALAAGADVLVIGRPILQAREPAAAARQLAARIAQYRG
jgi:orotidine-5'-phosphate decarboxylase